MRKAIRKARPWLLGALLLFFVVLIPSTSHPFQQCVNQPAYSSSYQAAKDDVAKLSIVAGSYRDCLGVFVHDNADAIIALFTIVLALSTIALYEATGGLVKGAEETSNRQLRAYVFPDSASLFDRGRPRKTRRTAAEKTMEGQVGGFLAIKNSGQTPAYKVAHFAGIVICTPADEDRLCAVAPFPKNPVGSGTLPPGGMMSKNVTRPEIITQEEIAAVKAGTKLIFLFGRIEYFDTLGKLRFTDYRLSFAGDYPPYGDVLLNFRDHGNDSDQNQD